MTEILTLLAVIVGIGVALKFFAPSKFEDIKKNILSWFNK
tara:strand:- start:1257 stop:1376 length:120 start_codon:yes stop_codon:yes gene_type:complete